MGHIQKLGLPCWVDSSLVALLGSVCKAGDVERRCGRKEIILTALQCVDVLKSYGLVLQKIEKAVSAFAVLL